MSTFIFDGDCLVLRSDSARSLATSLVLCALVNEGISLTFIEEDTHLVTVFEVDNTIYEAQWFSSWCLLFQVSEEHREYKRAYLRT